MSADAWALLAISALVIWGGLAGSVVWLARDHQVPGAAIADLEDDA